MSRHFFVGIAVAAVVAVGASQDAIAGDKASDAEIARGRYLVTIGGCSDCHTPGYPEQGGAVPESQWLTGVAVGKGAPSSAPAAFSSPTAPPIGIAVGVGVTYARSAVAAYCVHESALMSTTSSPEMFS